MVQYTEMSQTQEMELKKFYILNDKKIVYGGTSRAKRRFLHVRDAVNASIVMLEKNMKIKEFNHRE